MTKHTQTGLHSNLFCAIQISLFAVSCPYGARRDKQLHQSSTFTQLPIHSKFYTILLPSAIMNHVLMHGNEINPLRSAQTIWSSLKFWVAPTVIWSHIFIAQAFQAASWFSCVCLRKHCSECCAWPRKARQPNQYRREYVEVFISGSWMLRGVGPAMARPSDFIQSKPGMSSGDATNEDKFPFNPSVSGNKVIVFHLGEDIEDNAQHVMNGDSPQSSLQPHHTPVFRSSYNSESSRICSCISRTLTWNWRLWFFHKAVSLGKRLTWNQIWIACFFGSFNAIQGKWTAIYQILNHAVFLEPYSRS